MERFFTDIIITLELIKLNFEENEITNSSKKLQVTFYIDVFYLSTHNIYFLRTLIKYNLTLRKAKKVDIISHVGVRNSVKLPDKVIIQ